MTSMEERNRRLGETARNPQRRPAPTIAACRRVPTRRRRLRGGFFAGPSSTNPKPGHYQALFSISPTQKVPIQSRLRA